MATDTPIRTGLIGFGLAGRIFHAPFIATNPAFSLDVIATGNAARQAEARRLHPRASIVDGPVELLAGAGGLDLVILASPPATHREQALRAFEARAAVVVDKPFAASVGEAEDMISAAEAARVPFSVFQNRRWDGDFLTVKRLLRERALGDVHRFESTFERWSPALRDRWQDTLGVDKGAGIAYDLGSHVVDQALQLFGPATVTSAELTIARPGAASDDEAFLSLLHDSGVRSHLTVSRVAAQSGPRFRVLGSAGAYVVHGLDPQEGHLKQGGLPTDSTYGVAPESAWGMVGIDWQKDAPLSRLRTERGDYPAFYARMADSIRTGSPVPVPPRESLETMRIIDRAHELSGV